MKTKNLADEIREAVQELDLEIVSEYKKPCTFDKDLMIYYIEFNYGADTFILSASKNGYCLSNNKEPLKNSYTNSINAMKTIIILEISNIRKHSEEVC